MKKARCGTVGVAVGILVLAAGWVLAEKVSNGNDMVLNFMTGDKIDRDQIRKERMGKMHTFRYLKITSIEYEKPQPGSTTLETVEPSSEMKIRLIVKHKLSMEIADGVDTGMCVAVRGRVKEIGGGAKKDELLVDPAIIDNKDRCDVKLGNEMLNEVDERAH